GPVLGCDVTAAPIHDGAGAAGMNGWDDNQSPTAPRQFVFELAAKLTPTLVQHGPVEARLRAYMPSRMLPVSPRRRRHGLHVQVFHHDDRVGFADRVRDLVQEVGAGVRDAGMETSESPSG